MTIRLLIVDDHEILLRGLMLLIDGQQDLEVVGTADNGEEAIEKTLKLRPDIVLMDICMPVMDGLTATRKIRKLMPEVEVLILTMLDESDHLEEILESGASGYLLKTYGETEFFSAIHSVYSHLPYLYPHAMKHLMINQPEVSKSTKTSKKKVSLNQSNLSAREQEVLVLLSKGFYNKEIADKLFISVKTVESHKSKIMAKLQLFTRHELVSYAESNGLLNRKSDGD
ncbi:response regulator transcription factor [Paenibacillus sp. FSL F4-0125]|uniref:response regulator transcription factor n=1 Tax=Paenibacillus sp. FSL F4-0125 TaxID=2954730 RepID=UPI0030F6B083